MQSNEIAEPLALPDGFATRKSAAIVFSVIYCYYNYFYFVLFV